MPLNKQQLLIPRVLCVGGKEGEPNDTSGDFITGDILTQTVKSVHKWKSAKLKHSVYLDPDFIEKFPHLFKPLPWWYGRSVEEMPEYLIFIDDGKTEFVLKVEKYLFHKDTTEYWAFEYLWENEPDVKRMALSGWEPADESEYQEYKKSQGCRVCPDCDSIWSGNERCPECNPMG